ncbi:MAG: response regulator [Firmicutes bacterium]|nr:response regulator [Bacillota bacterium]
MYKLMILDDEKITIDGLIKHIEWGKYNIEIIAVANDGVDGLQKLSSQIPDIIITDVKMPNMNGIEFANIVAAKHPQIKIIFISGYDDIGFLRSALHVNAADYILKPVNLEKLSKAIMLVTERLDTEHKKRLMETDNEIKKFRYTQVLRADFFKKLVQNEIPSSHIDEKLKFLSLDININSHFCSVILLIDDYKKAFKSLSPKEQASFRFSILNIFQEIINTRFKGYIIEDFPDKLFGVVQIDGSSRELLSAELNRAKEYVLEILEIGLSVAIGMPYQGLGRVYKSYKSASEAIKQRFLLGKGQIIKANNIEQNKKTFFRISGKIIARIENTLKTGNGEEIKRLVGEIFADHKKTNTVNVSLSKQFALHLVSIATQLSIDNTVYSHEISKAEKKTVDLIENSETIDELQALVTNCFILVCASLTAKTKSKSSGLIEEIKSIIQKKYFEDITINDIASEVFLTPNYLCVLFKRATGMTINKYLNQVRIEAAKKLMQDRNNKAYDIGYIVGYSDASYFTKQFKNYTGLTPKQYRNAIEADE